MYQFISTCIHLLLQHIVATAARDGEQVASCKIPLSVSKTESHSLEFFIHPTTNKSVTKQQLACEKEIWMGVWAVVWDGHTIFFPPTDTKPIKNRSKQEIISSDMLFLSSSDSNKAPLWEWNLKCAWLGLEAVDVFVQLIWPLTRRQTNHWLGWGLETAGCRRLSFQRVTFIFQNLLLKQVKYIKEVVTVRPGGTLSGGTLRISSVLQIDSSCLIQIRVRILVSFSLDWVLMRWAGVWFELCLEVLSGSNLARLRWIWLLSWRIFFYFLSSGCSVMAPTKCLGQGL